MKSSKERQQAEKAEKKASKEETDTKIIEPRELQSGKSDSKKNKGNPKKKKGDPIDKQIQIRLQAGNIFEVVKPALDSK